MTIGLAEKIATVERLIEDLRWARSEHCPERHVYLVLKEIAGDLRGRLPGQSKRSRVLLEREIDNAKRSKTRLGYEVGSLRAVAEVTIGNWPLIAQALERFEEVERA